jgi:hypothetical protein
MTQPQLAATLHLGVQEEHVSGVDFATCYIWFAAYRIYNWWVAPRDRQRN